MALHSTENRELVEGNILQAIIRFAIPLLIGNLFQQLYNTVDSYVAGNYVSTGALAAVGASTPVINMLVGFFMGLSAGAGVVIAQYFGGEQKKELSDAVHSSMALTVLLSVLFTAAGVLFAEPLLRGIGVPEDVLPYSLLYLKIYFGGITFSLIYNIGAGILRAVGDSRTPLYFLAVACVINIALDLLFVCAFSMGIAGVGIATVTAQAISAALVLYKLLRTQDSYRLELRKIRFHKAVTYRIIAIGFPTALQQSVTAFSNVIVQSYINSFGTAVVAAYSATIRIDGFLMLILQSFNMTITTFVGQNFGAGEFRRVKKGIYVSWAVCSVLILAGAITMNRLAEPLIGIFTSDAEVIAAGGEMLRMFSFFYIVHPVIQILNGALRGAGHSKVPMYFMLGSFVVLRQIYLAIAVPRTNSVMAVMFGWPLTWIICAIGMVAYYLKVDWLPEEKMN